MKRFVFVLSLLCLGFGMGRAEAQPANTCVPPEAPKSECSADAECEKDGDSCTEPKCNLAIIDWKCAPGTTMADGKTGVSWTVGKCAVPEAPLANCNPPSKSCVDLFPGNEAAQRCCKDGIMDPAENKCCVEHVTHGDPYKDPTTGKLIPCDKECPKCPDCPQPEINCDKIVGNEDLKKCCTEKDKKLWFVLDACIPDGPGGSDDCNIVINAGGDFINSGQMNICCQVVNNTGTITGTTISQACNNTTGGGPSPTGGTPTTPSGSVAALGTCAIAPATSDVIKGKEFAFGKDWVVTYTPPSGVGPVASAHLTKVEGVEITADDPSDSTTGGWIKTIADPSSLPPFSVHTARPPEMVTEKKEQAQFKVRVQLKDLAGGELASMECDNAGFYEGQGGAGCGCEMTATLTPREQLLAYAVMAAFLSLPLFLFRLVRAGARKKGVMYE